MSVIAEQAELNQASMLAMVEASTNVAGAATTATANTYVVCASSPLPPIVVPPTVLKLNAIFKDRK